MKKGVLMFTACCLAVGMSLSTGSVALASKDSAVAGLKLTNTTQQAETVEGTEISETTEAAEVIEGVTEAAAEEEPAGEPVVDTSMSGEIAFAQCDEYINVRTSADTDSEVVGKVYNNGSVTILGQVGDWYEVQSGNATGYVKAEYFATGDEAQAIADEVAYNVATVYSDALVIRSDASEDSEQIGMAYASDELEVVDYSGDWMKVALGGDSYGYVNAYYVGYDTYYATAETLEEEQARLDQQWLDYLAEQEAQQAAAEQAYLDAIAAQEAAAQQAAWDAEYQAQQAAWDAEYQAQQEAQQAAWDAEYQAQQQAQTAADAQAAAEAEYQAYLDAQAAADAATQQADEQAAYDAAAQAQAEYQEYLAAQAAADAAAQAEADAAAQAQAAQQAADEAASYVDNTYTENTYTEDTYTEDTYTEDTYTEDTYEDTTDTSSYSLGQSIVDYAVQFVGNPYVWGGTSLTSGADCSGFTQSVMANFGISIPRTAASQSGSGTPVSLSDIQPGDLLFYEGSGGIGHVTIYMGNGQVVHASNESTGITISSYGYRTPVSARRYW